LLCCTALLVNLVIQAQDDLKVRFHEAYDAGEFKSALSISSQLITSDPTNASYRILQARIYLQLGNYDETIKNCYEALKYDKNNGAAYYLRGEVGLRTGSYGGAVIFFGKAMKYSVDPDVYFMAGVKRAEAYIQLRRYEEAYQDLLEAYEYAPSNMKVLLALSDALIQLEKYNEAIYTLNKIIAIDTAQVESYILLGELYLNNNNQLDLAYKNYKMAAQLQPNNIDVLNQLGEICYEKNEFDNGMKWLHKATILDPDRPDTYKIKALHYFNIKEYEQGCNTLFKALQLGYIEKYGYDALDLYIEQCE
jgi:tetratricopeptide (TPR) repeat protein